jgi:hypothetical protein
MNIPNADKTFISINQGATWQQSAFAGSVMIRPIFSTSMDFTLGIEDVKEEFKTELYPNPASESINLRFSDSGLHEVELIDLMGTVLLRSSESKIDISQLKNGVYLVRVLDSKEVIKFIKL